jgi:hypothetical protein
VPFRISVGTLVLLYVGLGVGDLVCALLGLTVGALVFLNVGLRVGAFVRFENGLTVGVLDRLLSGLKVGTLVGLYTGIELSFGLGDGGFVAILVTLTVGKLVFSEVIPWVGSKDDEWVGRGLGNSVGCCA